MEAEGAEGGAHANPEEVRGGGAGAAPPSPPHRARAPPPLSRGPPETPPFRVPPLGACGAGGLALRPSPYSHPACAIPPPTCGVSGRAHAESVAGGALTG